MGDESVTVQIIPPVPPEPVVVINMTRAHAQAIMDVFWNVGGNPQTTARGKIDELYDALHLAGFCVDEDAAFGSVYLKY